jgi:hypothetical protein
MTITQQTEQKTHKLTLRDFALAAFATIIPPDEAHSVEAAYVRHQYQIIMQQSGDFIEALGLALDQPANEDAPLLLLASEFEFMLVEVLTIALLQVVEEQLLAGRVIAYLQAPQPRKRPTLGLVAHGLASIAPPDSSVLDMLVIGNAMRAGVLQTLGEASLPLVDRPMYISEALRLALNGHYLNWP